jgi:hypothetical protein
MGAGRAIRALKGRSTNDYQPSTGGLTARTLARGIFVLVCVSPKNPRNHWSILFLQLMASRRVLQFNAFTFATNQARFPENLEMLRHRGSHPFLAIQKTFPGLAANRVPVSRHCGPVEQVASRLQR